MKILKAFYRRLAIRWRNFLQKLKKKNQSFCTQIMMHSDKKLREGVLFGIGIGGILVVLGIALSFFGIVPLNTPITDELDHSQNRIFTDERRECLRVPDDFVSAVAQPYSIAGMAGKYLHAYITTSTQRCVHDHVLVLLDREGLVRDRFEVHPEGFGEKGEMCSARGFVVPIKQQHEHASLRLRGTVGCGGPTTETVFWAVSDSAVPDWDKRDYRCQCEDDSERCAAFAQCQGANSF